MANVSEDPTKEIMATLAEFKSVIDDFSKDELSSMASSYIANADKTTKEIINQAKSRGIDLNDENWDNDEVSKEDKTFISDLILSLSGPSKVHQAILDKASTKGIKLETVEIDQYLYELQENDELDDLELSEEALATVSGGAFWFAPLIAWGVAKIAAYATVGKVAAAVVGPGSIAVAAASTGVRQKTGKP